MTRTVVLGLAVLHVLAGALAADQSVARLRVGSDGSWTGAVRLEPGSRYVVVARESVYFGRSWRNRRSLLNDACFEFNAAPSPVFLPILKNSLGVPVCDGEYNGAHVYRSRVFVASGEPLRFYIEDTDYRDNRGSLELEVYRVGGGSRDLELDTNRYGGDYRWFELDSGPRACQAACRSEARCRSFTYVRPGVQGRRARCWLKDRVPTASRSRDCVSGVVD